MLGAGQRGIDSLFRLRRTAGVKRLITLLCASDEWLAAGQGWQGVRSHLRLQGWSRSRGMIVLCRQMRDSLAFGQSTGRQSRQLSLGLSEVLEGRVLYEYAVLVPSLDEELEALVQLYRESDDAENNFDELKTQWGWTGYTTRDLKRSRVMAGVIAFVYNCGDCSREWRQGRSDHDAAAGAAAAAAAARHCAPYAERTSNHADDHEFARQGKTGPASLGGGQRLSQARGGNCGAVRIAEALATHPELDLPRFPGRQGRRHPSQAC